MITLTSCQKCKVEAVQKVFHDVKSCKTNSGVSEQPYGRIEIRKGALNRLDQVLTLPAISLETGIIENRDKNYCDITCCVLRTRLGTFEAWSNPVDHDAAKVEVWKKMPNRRKFTVGFLYGTPDPHDWYVSQNGKESRSSNMAGAVQKVYTQYRAVLSSMPASIIPATLSDFHGVQFIDIQYPLVHFPNELTITVRRLADRLLFDTVVVMDARGFLLAGEFMREGYPVVMARKPGKLPNQEHQVEYKKEYGVDTLCISKDTIKPGARVIIVDDLIATGGTMRAAEQLVLACKATVVAFIAPYAIVDENGQELAASVLGPRMRYLCNQKDVSSGTTSLLMRENWLLTNPKLCDRVFITPPSLKSLTIDQPNVPIKWGRFRFSSNIWFEPSCIESRTVYVLLNPSVPNEMVDVLQVLSILYRKDPKKVRVVIPFLEQATQDRVEFKSDRWESMAAVDTLSKLIGQYTILTFDLHAEQSRFAFYDLRFDSLVAKLWEKYRWENPKAIVVFPDEGAAKRFGKLPQITEPVVFRKKRQGDKRIVATDDPLTRAQAQYVIIDDLVRSGGTMCAVAQQLYEKKADRVDALFAHAALEPSACSNMEIFKEVWTSDSNPQLVPSEWVKIRIVDVLTET